MRAGGNEGAHGAAQVGGVSPLPAVRQTRPLTVARPYPNEKLNLTCCKSSTDGMKTSDRFFVLIMKLMLVYQNATRNETITHRPKIKTATK